jgi:hypothetical protein
MATVPQIAAHLRLELEDQWRERVMSAQSEFDLAVAQFRAALEDRRNWHLRAPDGSAAIRHARLRESAARGEYARVLGIFSELLIHGTIPDER